MIIELRICAQFPVSNAFFKFNPLFAIRNPKLGLEDSRLLETEIPGLAVLRGANDQMIDKLNLKHPSTLRDAACEPQVRVTGSGITGRMVVNKQKRVGGMGDRWLEDFAGMSQALIDGAF